MPCQTGTTDPSRYKTWRLWDSRGRGARPGRAVAQCL